MFRYIRAMSFSKQAIEADIRQISGPLTDHLTKLYLFPYSEYTAHWSSEVWSFLNRVPKMKGSNKFPSKKLILKNVSGYTDMVDEIMYFIMEEYSDLTPERYNAEELGVIMTKYFDWLAETLSSKGIIQSHECYQQLRELGL